jgi:hypothetical protein
MESKHTPGPWKFGETPSLDGQGIAFEVDTDDFTIAHVYPAFDSGNAALIAAAPDMYEALQTVRLVFPEHPSTLHNPTRVMVESVLAALAKAEGQ